MGNMKFFAAALALFTMALAAASLIAACGDGGETSTTPAETLAATSPTAAPPTAPTATPDASPTAAPASNIPVPTRVAVRTPTAVPVTPTPTPTRAETLVATAREAISDAESWAFSVNAVITGADGGEVRVEISGDYLDGAFMLANGSSETQDSAFDLRIARFEDARYAMSSADDDDDDNGDDNGGGWRELASPPPFDLFSDAGALLRADGLRDAGREVSSGGAEFDAVSGKASPYGSGAEFDAVYLFAPQDGALREIRIAGETDFGALYPFAAQDGTPGATASVEATVVFSDFGKPVALASPRMIFPPFDHDAIALADGRVMVLGGVTGIANNNVIAPFPIPLPQFYDFADSLWTLGLTSAELYDADMNEDVMFPAGFFHSAIALDGGGGAATAGFGGDEEVTSLVREYDSASGEWRTLAGMETARGAPVLALLADGSIIAAGGLDLESLAAGDAPPRTVETAEIYDRETDSWRTASAMSGAASPGMALIALADGRALALFADPDAGEALRGLEDGGRVEDGALSETAVLAEIYDPETDAWTPTARPEISRAEPTAIRLSDGGILVTGAGVERREIDSPTAVGIETIPAFAAEIYDPATDEWTRTAPMLDFRASHTLTILSDGRILAAGGQDPRTSDYALYATTEIYDPATNEWTAGLDMSQPRMSHAATRAPDGGGAFITGGIGVHPANGEIYPLNSAEVVDGG